ncbi:RhuM family protein [Lachnospiraceae bacterium HCP28S3_F9]
MNRNEIIIFETEDHQIKLEVNVESETVWLSANQMALLFERDEKTIRKHINNVFSESEVDKINNTQKMRVEGVKQLVPFYTLDVIISVGYRVKSKRGVEFRRWANSVLKQYILKGYAVNDNRIKQLGEVIRIMKRTENELDSKQVLSVIEKYSNALDLLDSYDHQNMTRPKGNEATYVLQYEECMEVIQSMRFGDELYAIKMLSLMPITREKPVLNMDMAEFCTMQKMMIRLQAEGKHKPWHRSHDREG